MCAAVASCHSAPLDEQVTMPRWASARNASTTSTRPSLDRSTRMTNTRRRQGVLLRRCSKVVTIHVGISLS
jgi:hypothetical protein